jgi:hypothetical protein
MRRTLLFGIALLVATVGLQAQEIESYRPVFRLGGGVDWADYTCGGCVIDSKRGFSAFLAAGLPVSRVVTLGLEAALSHGNGNTSAPGVRPDLTLVGALATVGARGGAKLPVWGTVGLGWIWYSGPGPSSSGPGLSTRAGVDIPITPRFALSPYAGYLTMLGHEGPDAVICRDICTTEAPIAATRLSSLQLGVAATLRP